MTLFSKFSQKVINTGNKWTQGVSNLFSDDPITDIFWNKLEEQLILGDVGIDLTDTLLDKLKKIVIDRRISKTVELSEAFAELLIDLLDSVPGMGEQLKIETKPSIIILIGVNGSGKTTTVGKLAALLKSDGKKVIIAAADTFRAAAIEQLQTWGKKISVRVIAQQQESDPAAVVYDAIMSAKTTCEDVVIVDTAGRLHTQSNLMEELAKIYRVVKRELPEEPAEVLIVLDAVTGQNGFLQAETFNKVIPITGIILTKFDNTSKGGIVLSIADKLKLPIRYIGLGENIKDLQLFNSRAFVESLLNDN